MTVCKQCTSKTRQASAHMHAHIDLMVNTTFWTSHHGSYVLLSQSHSSCNLYDYNRRLRTEVKKKKQTKKLGRNGQHRARQVFKTKREKKTLPREQKRGRAWTGGWVHPRDLLCSLQGVRDEYPSLIIRRKKKKPTPNGCYFKKKKWNRKTNVMGKSTPDQNLNRACSKAQRHWF